MDGSSSCEGEVILESRRPRKEDSREAGTDGETCIHARKNKAERSGLEGTPQSKQGRIARDRSYERHF